MARRGIGFVRPFLFKVMLIPMFVAPGTCDEVKGSANPKIKKFRSTHLELFTDISPTNANALLVRLESKIRFISKYWRRTLDGKIIGYVAGDLDNWNDEDFPHAQAKILLKHVKGAVPRGSSKSKGNFAFLYATSEPGVAEHEIVHAYCQLVFGTCGPDWYKEGMAEMAAHDSTRGHSFHCTDDVMRILKANQNMAVTEIVNAGRFTKPVSEVFANLDRHERSEKWSSTEDDIVQTARETYEQSWSLCHFLCNNRNYRNRFRLLGLAYLSGRKCQFETLFAPTKDRLDFEYRFFLNHVENGYRVDLCSWDWEKEFESIDDNNDSKLKDVNAAFGFQPSGLLVTKGKTYRFQADGQWSIDAGKTKTDANGDRLGRGCLEGVILKDDFNLSLPFRMGTTGSFCATDSGKLYLRCKDEWNQIANNRERIKVALNCVNSDKQSASQE